MKIELGSWNTLGRDAMRIRTAVFVIEQNVPADLEHDHWDELSVHALARDEQQRSLGTGRLLPDGHIGRMAVLAAARRAGVGSALLRTLIEEARGRGHSHIVLSAQTRACAFYARHGFEVQGAQYMEAGIAHVMMQCAL